MLPKSPRRRWIGPSIALFCLLFPESPSPAAEGKAITVQPQDNGQALVNPGMGWTLHFYSNLIENYGSKLEPSDTLDDWPGLSTIYLRVPWSFLEPQEGRFNWSLFDTPTQPGTYSLWVSVGALDGTPQIALPMPGDDGRRRYRLGQIEVVAPSRAPSAQ